MLQLCVTDTNAVMEYMGFLQGYAVMHGCIKTTSQHSRLPARLMLVDLFSNLSPLWIRTKYINKYQILYTLSFFSIQKTNSLEIASSLQLSQNISL